MVNLKYILVIEKSIAKIKNILLNIIRLVFRKGLSRMYKYNFENTGSFEILMEIFKQNSNKEMFNLFNKFIFGIFELFFDYVQKFINMEIGQFKKENPQVELTVWYKTKRISKLGEIKIKLLNFRNAEFKSVIIGKKFRTFVIEIFELVNLIRIGSMSLEDIKRYFRNYNISITNELISKISKLKLEKEQEYLEKQEQENDTHQLALFIDGRWNKYIVQEPHINQETGELTYLKVCKKVVELITVGISSNGTKRVITSIVADNENSFAYYTLFNKIKNECDITKIDLVVSDGTNAINNALLEFFPNAKKTKMCLSYYEWYYSKNAKRLQKRI